MTDPSKVMARSEWMKYCRYLFYFCTVILAEAFLDKFHDFGILHKKLCQFLQVHPTGRVFISVFRGSYKTTVLIGFFIWMFFLAVVDRIARSMCYNTATKDNAENFSKDVRDALKNVSPFLHWISGGLFPKDPEKEFDSFTKWKVQYKWVRIVFSSMDTKQVSRHHDIIVNDDLVDDDNAYSELERKRIVNKWKYQKSIITKYKKRNIGLELDVGTPFHPKDLVNKIWKTASYDKFIVPCAIGENGKPVDIFKRNGLITFPEMFTWEDFQEKYEDQGASIFNSQYLLRCTEESDLLAIEEWIKYWRFLPDNTWRAIVIDPAGTENKDNEPTGINITDWDSTGYGYEIHSEEIFASPMQLIRKMEEMEEEYKPDEVFIEREKYSISIADVIDATKPHMDLNFVDHKNKPKESRINKGKQYIEAGRYLFRQGSKLVKYVLDYPDVSSKNMLDAWAYQFQVKQIPDAKMENEREVEVAEGFEEELEKIKALSNYQEVNDDAYF